jgi:hypothetical protein
MMKLIRINLLGILFLFFSCNQQSTGPNPGDDVNTLNGIMKISLDMSEAPSDVVRLEGALASHDKDEISFDFTIIDNQAMAFVEDIPSGNWLLTVEAFNTDNQVIYTGTAEITVHSGIVTPVSIHLNPATGSLQISVTWGDEPGLVAYYPFDGDATDKSGNNHHGRILGAAMTDDRFGNENSAYYFDGIDDYISIDDGGGIAGLDEATIMLWIKWSGNQDYGSPGYGVVFGRQRDDVFTNQVLTLSSDDPDFAKVMWYPYTAFDPAITSSTKAGNDVWRHVAVTYSSGNHRLFIDGELEGISDMEGSMSFDNTVALTIGGGIDDIESYSRSCIDEVRIYDGVLSNAQIKSLYSDGTPILNDDEFEENDLQSDAVPLFEDVDYNDLTISAQDDDWYALTLSADHLLIECGFNHINGDVNIDLVDGNGTIIASSHSQTDNERIGLKVDKLETYYLHVYLSSGISNKYTLWWDDAGPEIL